MIKNPKKNSKNSKKYRLQSDPPDKFASGVQGLSDLSKKLLYRRGINNPESIESFLNPDYVRHIHKPSLLKNIDKASERIIAALEKGEKIVIYGDYDTDGIPASVIWHEFLTRISYKNFTNYIPHRHDEGFGLHADAIRSFANDKVDLVVTVDCGIADVEAVQLANSLEIDVIITDHHMPGEILPPAYTIVNPKQIGCEYPEKMLCGSAVAFKLVQNIIVVAKKMVEGIAEENPLPPESIIAKIANIPEGWDKWLLDMVGIATISDMVPLTGENRTLAHFGLRVLRKTRRLGLRALLTKLGIRQDSVTEDDIGFSIGPRINAASRMSTPMDAFNLLISSTEAEAINYTNHLNDINDKRKTIVAGIVKDMKSHIRERFEATEAGLPKVIVIGNPSWQPGILGLVANSCADEFSRPLFVWGRDGDGVIKGSCRGAGIVNVVELMKKVPEGTFLQYGGHAASGGFAVPLDRIHALHDVLNLAAEAVPYGNLADEVVIDAELSLDDVTNNMYSEIERFAPFGMSNPKPLFLFRLVKPREVKVFGKKRDHLELIFNNSKDRPVSAIAFFKGTESFNHPLAGDIGSIKPFDMIASLEKSTFAGRTTLRLRIADIVSSV